jgi:hypothetical protein
MNRSNPLCWLVLLSLFSLGLSAQTKQTDESSKNGRYQIIAVTLSDTGSGRAVQTVMKIDSQTGKVWKLVSHSMEIEGGARFPMEGWQEVVGSFDEAVERFNRAVKEKEIQPK